MFCFSVIHRDGDGVPDGYDNCVDLPNGEQADVDDDKIGIPVKEIVHFLSRERGYYSFSESKPCEWFTVWPTTFGAEIVRTSNYFAIYQFTTGMKLKTNILDWISFAKLVQETFSCASLSWKSAP